MNFFVELCASVYLTIEQGEHAYPQGGVKMTHVMHVSTSLMMFTWGACGERFGVGRTSVQMTGSQSEAPFHPNR